MEMLLLGYLQNKRKQVITYKWVYALNLTMPPTGGQGDEEPLMSPKLVRALRNRNRLVDFGVRESMLEGVEQQIKERRKPSRVSERASSTVADTVRNAAEPVTRDVAKGALDRANDSVLDRF